MKKIIILLLVLITGFGSFAQKSKIKSKLDTTTLAFYTCPMHPEVKSNKPGKCSKCGRSLMLSTKEKMKMDVMKIYTCPMHPLVKSDKPGKCPECGMDLVLTKEVKQKNHK